jgi:methionine sulfoxide reductase heme-binding subunit
VSNPLWLVDRSAGEVTLLLMSAVVILGIVRAAMPRLNPFLAEGLHANIALMAIAFAGLHVVAAIADPFARLSALDALIPFQSEYRRAWLGLGVISAYLYLAAALSSWPRRRLPRGAWLWLHRAMYGAWAVAILHSLGTGSDARSVLFLALDVVAVAGVLAVFLGIRAVEGWARRRRLWPSLAIAAVVGTVALGAWAVNGPLQSGWARASGTPPDLLGSR